MSNMLINIIAGAISQMPDAVVAGHVASQEDVAFEIHLNAADAIIMQTREPGATANFTPLLRQFPDLKIIAINSTGDDGFVHQLRPYCMHFAEFSVAALQSALRASSAPIRRVRRL
jgi:hypothetical protein